MASEAVFVSTKEQREAHWEKVVAAMRKASKVPRIPKWSVDGYVYFKWKLVAPDGTEHEMTKEDAELFTENEKFTDAMDDFISRHLEPTGWPAWPTCDYEEFDFDGGIESNEDDWWKEPSYYYYFEFRTKDKHSPMVDFTFDGFSYPHPEKEGWKVVFFDSNVEEDEMRLNGKTLKQMAKERGVSERVVKALIEAECEEPLTDDEEEEDEEDADEDEAEDKEDEAKDKEEDEEGADEEGYDFDRWEKEEAAEENTSPYYKIVRLNMEDACDVKDTFWGTETTCLTKKDALLYFINQNKDDMSPKKYKEIMTKISTPEGVDAYINFLENKKNKPVFFLKAGETNPKLTRIVMEVAY